MQGKIIKGIGGFYYVRDSISAEIIECRARGKFRKLSLAPAVGDNVEYELTDEPMKGSITDISQRKNLFVRPPISNIDRLVIVVSCNNPKPDFAFIDKMLVICAIKNVDAALCISKADLAYYGQIEEITGIYSGICPDIFVTSKFSNDETERMKGIFAGKTTAFSGFSGVGKSTLLNELLSSDVFATGEVSGKIGRGKHTTRHVELIEAFGGYLADTPGFGSLELPDIEPDCLKDCFAEFEQFESECRFSGCVHTGTKFCGVYNAVQNGLISPSRYNSYKEFYKTLKEKREW